MFEQGFEAMRELLESERRGDAGPRPVAVQASERAALLAEWLGGLAFDRSAAGWRAMVVLDV